MTLSRFIRLLLEDGDSVNWLRTPDLEPEEPPSPVLTSVYRQAYQLRQPPICWKTGPVNAFPTGMCLWVLHGFTTTSILGWLDGRQEP